MPIPDRPRAGRALLGLAAAVAAILGFATVGRDFYDDFQLRHGVGMYSLRPEELSFAALFVAFGGIAWVGLAVALEQTRVPDTVVRAAAGLRTRLWPCSVGAGVAAALASLAISALVLGHGAVADDEHVYDLIARTLRTGHLTAPSPGGEVPFFREQFVVVTPTARYGKYPIGFPLLLAAGQSLHASGLVVPLLTGLLVVGVAAVARQLAGPTAALLATALACTSPQVLFTGATQLSQPAAAACILFAVWFLLQADSRDEGWMAPTLCAGALLGFGVLVRPLPGVLFIPVAVAFAWWPRRARSRAAALLAPVAAWGVVMLLVNAAQTGHPLSTAYGDSMREQGGAVGMIAGTAATRAMSLVGSVLRLDLWLHGWPLSLGLCAAAGLSRRVALPWGMVAADLAYRLVSPKIGVGGTGPLYLFEAVPLLCVLGALGARRLASGNCGVVVAPRRLAAITLAGTAVSLCAFVPSRMADLARMGAAQTTVQRAIARQEVRNAVVFHEGVVPWWSGLSWAYYPPCNGPLMDDPVLYLLFDRDDPARNAELARARFPTRSAWYFGYLEGRPRLLPLAEYLRAGAPVPAPRP